MQKILPILFLLASYSTIAQTEVELAGKLASTYPYFHWVQNFNNNQQVNIAIDTQLYPALIDVNADVYFVNDKSAAEWALDNTLSDQTNSGAEAYPFNDGNIALNTFQHALPGELVDYTGPGIGVGYDVVIDVDDNGVLSSPDFIDGADGAGFFVVHDITYPGSLSVTTQDWTDEEELTKRIWYPENIADFSSLPLIVISHGWTHEYTYYDYIGEHLASYGYIVMAHWNDVGDGDPAATNSASLSLLANIDHLLANQSTLFGGVLNGKIDSQHQAWIGHSTGGETPVRAYTRLHEGENSSAYFSWQHVRAISSICPVAWFSMEFTNPFDVNYHQFLGGADTDASGFPGDGYYQPLSIFERATGNRQVTYVHGAGHEVFHGFDSSETWPDALASGPDLLAKPQVHAIVKSYFLALCELYVKENVAGKEFFTRSFSEYHPIGIDDAVTVTNEYRDAHFAEKFVIDDFESNAETNLSSAGFSVDWGTTSPVEILMQDIDNSLAYDLYQPSNGMSRARFDDDPNCAVFSWDGNDEVVYSITDIDFGDYDFLSFRACQMTRHPYNETNDGSITFSVELADGNSNTSTINIAEYSPIKQTYQRDEGGELHLCLPSGDYTVEVAGTFFPSETFFEIPGYINYSSTGSYEFTIATKDSCETVDVYMYDEYGDGWDNGDFTMYDADGDTVAYGTLFSGTGPVPGIGWQNEFCTVRIPLDEFLINDSQLDLDNITNLTFIFGEGDDAATGALGIDDIELVKKELNVLVAVEEQIANDDAGFFIYPNPANDFINLVFEKTMKGAIEIFDVSGKIVLRKELKNETFIRLPVDEIAGGFYFARVTSANYFASAAFVIIRE